MSFADVDIIFFDAGGTLLYPDPPVGEVYSRAGRRHGVQSTPAEMEEVFWATFAAMPTGPEAQTPAWWRDLLGRVFGRFGEPTDFEGLIRFLDDWFGSARAFSLFPGAREAILTLARRGYRTGLISNWEAKLRRILEELDLIPLLDPAIISAEIGAEKPDPEIYRAALKAAGVEPDRAVLVGDTLEADGLGAVAAGMGAVLINQAEPPHPRIRTIKAIAELPALFPER
jgi:putative hydrolase of the HAD superfamily